MTRFSLPTFVVLAVLLSTSATAHPSLPGPDTLLTNSILTPVPGESTFFTDLPLVSGIVNPLLNGVVSPVLETAVVPITDAVVRPLLSGVDIPVVVPLAPLVDAVAGVEIGGPDLISVDLTATILGAFFSPFFDHRSN